VADVSGKGIGAALLMSSIQASLRALVGPQADLPAIVTRMNELIHRTTAANKYATAFFMMIDPLSREIGYVNAGHNDGLVIRRDGTVERLKSSGTPVGLLATRTYILGNLELGEGDIVALYSDGVTEANDPDENELGDARLVECLKANAARDAAGLVDAVFAEVEAFQSTAPQYDDITLMVIKGTT
jgi:Serine phosphatase RsbU, regulator of sigma subunit